jgi:hypothetical protein
MSKTILEGPDGMLYEIPDDVLAGYAVPGNKVLELRKQMEAAAGAGSDDDAPPPTEHVKLGELTPDHPGYAQQQAILAAVEMASTTVAVFVGDGSGPPKVTINGAELAAPGADEAAASADDVEGYHMTFDESGIPIQHTDMLWGDYIDKQGNPAVGFHSHDPVSGNAQ